MVSCFVIGCKSGYHGSKTHLFRAPKTADKSAWLKNIPKREIPFDFIKSAICYLHFEDGCINKGREFITINGKQVKLPSQPRWALKSNAVPTKFPNQQLRGRTGRERSVSKKLKTFDDDRSVLKLKRETSRKNRSKRSRQKYVASKHPKREKPSDFKKSTICVNHLDENFKVKSKEFILINGEEIMIPTRQRWMLKPDAVPTEFEKLRGKKIDVGDETPWKPTVHSKRKSEHPHSPSYIPKIKYPDEAERGLQKLLRFKRLLERERKRRKRSPTTSAGASGVHSEEAEYSECKTYKAGPKKYATLKEPSDFEGKTLKATSLQLTASETNGLKSEAIPSSSSVKRASSQSETVVKLALSQIQVLKPGASRIRTVKLPALKSKPLAVIVNSQDESSEWTAESVNTVNIHPCLVCCKRIRHSDNHGKANRSLQESANLMNLFQKFRRYIMSCKAGELLSIKFTQDTFPFCSTCVLTLLELSKLDKIIEDAKTQIEKLKKMVFMKMLISENDGGDQLLSGSRNSTNQQGDKEDSQSKEEWLVFLDQWKKFRRRTSQQYSPTVQLRRTENEDEVEFKSEPSSDVGSLIGFDEPGPCVGAYSESLAGNGSTRPGPNCDSEVNELSTAFCTAKTNVETMSPPKSVKLQYLNLVTAMNKTKPTNSAILAMMRSSKTSIRPRILKPVQKVKETKLKRKVAAKKSHSVGGEVKIGTQKDSTSNTLVQKNSSSTTSARKSSNTNVASRRGTKIIKEAEVHPSTESLHADRNSLKNNGTASEDTVIVVEEKEAHWICLGCQERFTEKDNLKAHLEETPACKAKFASSVYGKPPRTSAKRMRKKPRKPVTKAVLFEGVHYPFKIEGGCYKCCRCRHYFASAPNLYKHIAQAHFPRSAQLPEPQPSMSTSSDVMTSVKDLEGESLGASEGLWKNVSIFDKYSAQNFRNESGEQLWKCLACKNLFNQLYSLKCHILTSCAEINDGKDRSCFEEEENKFLFGRKFPFEFINGQYKCGICEITDSKKDSLMFHIAKDHRDKTAVETAVLKLVETSPNNFLYASKFPAEKVDDDFCCRSCSYQTKDVKLLKKHLDKDHLNVNKHVCEVCGQDFPSFHSLTRHQVKSHKPEIQLEKHDKRKKGRSTGQHKTQKKPESRPFMCEICGKIVVSYSSLRYHYERHKGLEEVGVICDICGKKVFRQYLKRHISSHQVPFECKACNKRFAHRKSLRSHEVLYHGAKFIPCDICGKKYALSRSVTKHKITCHNVTPESGSTT